MLSTPPPSALVRASLLLLVAVLCATTIAAQPPPEEPEPGTPQRYGVTSGLGWVEVDGVERRLPVTITPAGPLFSLPVLVEMLGGELVAGPLEISHTLTLDGTELVLGPDTSVMTMGEEIIAIGQVPRMSLDGFEVPLEALRRSYGDLLGYRFRWLPEERRLLVDRGSGEALSLEVDWVHSQGITTLVLVFPERPRYRVDLESNPIRVELTGRRFDLAGVPATVEDPLVQRLSSTGSVLRIFLDEDAAAAEPYEIERGSRFELVFDISRAARARVSDPINTLGTRSGDGLRIVLDPGHGGSETGTVGPSGVTEKELTLLIARRLRSRLAQRLGVEVVLTRDEDMGLPLDARTAIANQNRADLFLSLHLNSEPWGSGARGAETYFLSMEASDARAAAAAEAENRGAELPATARDEELDLQLVLWDLAQNHHLAESQRLANIVQQELNQALDLRDRGVKQAPFRVLMGATMPAVLIELGFLSNPEEEERLRDPVYRLELVDALVRALQRFLARSASSADPTVDLDRP